MTLLQVTEKLKEELEMNILGTCRVRRYADLIGIQRSANNYRDFTDEDVKSLVKVIALAEIGVGQKLIQCFYHGTLESYEINIIKNKILTLNSKAVPIALEAISRYEEVKGGEE